MVSLVGRHGNFYQQPPVRPERQWCCVHCSDAVFDFNRELDEHYVLVHPRLTKFYCVACCNWWSDEDQYDFHLERGHIGRLPIAKADILGGNLFVGRTPMEFYMLVKNGHAPPAGMVCPPHPPEINEYKSINEAIKEKKSKSVWWRRVIRKFQLGCDISC